MGKADCKGISMCGCQSVSWGAAPHCLRCCPCLLLLTSGVSIASTLYAFLYIHLLLTDLYLSSSRCLSMKMFFQGVLLLPCFFCLHICDAAFVLFSKETHLDWFSSIFMYKLSSLAIVSDIGDFLLSISPFRSFFSYRLNTQTSFPLLVSFLDLHQIDCSRTANAVYLSPALSNFTYPYAHHISHCCKNAANYSTVKFFPPPWRFFVSQILNSPLLRVMLPSSSLPASLVTFLKLLLFLWAANFVGRKNNWCWEQAAGRFPSSADVSAEMSSALAATNIDSSFCIPVLVSKLAERIL